MDCIVTAFLYTLFLFFCRASSIVPLLRGSKSSCKQPLVTLSVASRRFRVAEEVFKASMPQRHGLGEVGARSLHARLITANLAIPSFIIEEQRPSDSQAIENDGLSSGQVGGK